ncbi:MAG: N-succinylarginine dihydrolase [Hyphomonadaceae bacterium]|nr:N-succinylarginine dihydrolase [Hyphomonadaceae bacterium]
MSPIPPRRSSRRSRSPSRRRGSHEVFGVTAVEINFDGLVGPTHNYAGLSEGNLASERNRDMVSRPRAAALQGLAKMRRLMELGLVQGVLPPHERPEIRWLRSLGFAGTDAQVWEAVWRTDERLARAAIAASAMWTANWATISPSADTDGGKLHITPANLTTMLHRALEAETSGRALRRIFPFAAHHAPLIGQASFSDEGAANHMRLCAEHGAPGVEIFVYGRRASDPPLPGFPARQTLEACQAIARLHRLDPKRTCFIRQSRKAIDAGAFHNDVVAVSCERTLFHHAEAFEDRDAALKEIRAACDFEPEFVEVPSAAVPLGDAVSSYLFNSQLVKTGHGLTLIAPTETRENNRTAPYVNQMLAGGGPIGKVEHVEVRESMRNGGGPACLRLRVVVSDEERRAIPEGFVLTEARIVALEAWVSAHYRETLAPADLADPNLVGETQRALDALTKILPLGDDFYPFQRG